MVKVKCGKMQQNGPVVKSDGRTLTSAEFYTFSEVAAYGAQLLPEITRKYVQYLY
jgi:hypothetical protein